MKTNRTVFALVLSFFLLINIPVSAETGGVKTFKLEEENYLSTEGVDYSQSFEDFLISAFDNHKATVDVYSFLISSDDLNAILIDILNDYPEYFCVDLNSSTYSVYRSLVISINFGYFYSKEVCDERQSEVECQLKQPLKIISKLKSDEDKIVFIHDYIITNNAYDKDGISGDLDKVSKDSFNAYGCLVLKKSVCQGISDAFVLICKRAGLNASLVSSDEMCHAWNIVELNGNYYHLDVPWDDTSVNNYGFIDINGSCSHNYFLKSDSQFLSLSHSNWEAKHSADDSSTYLDAYWSRVYSPIIFINDYSYYIKNYCLIKRDLTDKTETVVYDELSDFGEITGNSTLAYDYSGDYFFINLSDGIYAFDTITEEIFKVFESEDKIIGIAFDSGVLKYDTVQFNGSLATQLSDNTAKVVFPSDKVLLGDLNRSDKVDIKDILVLKKCLVESFEGFSPYIADMNSDGKTDALDLVLIRKLLSQSF